MRKQEIKRKQDRRNNAIAFVIIGIVVIVVGVIVVWQAATPQPVSTQVAGSSTSTTLDGKTLLEQRCNDCHSSDYVTGLKGTADQWAGLVSNMVGRGANLNAQEEKALAAYLAQTYHP